MVPASVISPYALFLRDGRACGRVHSAFASSFNMEIGKRLVHVGGDDAPLSCLGMQVSASSLRSMLRAVRAGNQVVARGGIVRIYTTAATLELDVRDAGIELCSIPACVDASGAAWAYGRLRALPIERRIGLPLDGATAERLCALAYADCAGVARRDAVLFLTGRGKGLTPSGDDVLLGFAAALRMMGRESGLGRAIADAARGRTTDVSCAYADAFARGWANPVYRELACAIARRDIDAFCRATALVCAIGHTSGWDALFGMRLGFAHACASVEQHAGTASFAQIG